MYGVLYNWYTVNTKKLCPTGWNVPTDAEYNTLITYLGGESVSGGKLKETGTKNWYTPNTGATNLSGFLALPGGTRYPDGEFIDLGARANFWSVTGLTVVNAYALCLSYNNSNAAITSNNNKSSGFSVRCEKSNLTRQQEFIEK